MSFSNASDLFKEYADKSGGVVTWPFDQEVIAPCYPGVSSSLCAHWIRYHNADGHLSGELYDKNDPDKLNEAMVGQIHALEESNLRFVNMLQSLGLCMKKSVTGSKWAYSAKNNKVNELICDDACTQSHLLVNAIMKYISCYLLIFVHGYSARNPYPSGFGHVLCVWLGQHSGGDVCFFEPNAGEVWFEERCRFAKFARDYLGDLMLMDNYAEWEVHPVM
ncbi:hypothetical protein [Candidatus Sororendozoicomonas aggregata]|uniref:hypothetical protein n=1 Tax=Candidatus Sororendozoicomonas aggregata TaxID=3073239 RepID=UPI002ED36795